MSASPDASRRRDLEAAVHRLGRASRLLVVADFDGTLSPIVPDPGGARPDPEALAALDRIAALPATRAAILSGRSLEDLRARVGGATAATLVGSHGAETDGRPLDLSPDAARARAEIEAALRRIAARFPAAVVEPKPASVAFHYRRVEEGRRDRARAEAVAVAEPRPGVQVRTGKMVVELMVVSTDKGEALRRLRRPDETVFFVGDDVTDEDAFAALQAGDVGVKVGAGRTRAGWRVEGQERVADLLGRVAAARRPPAG